jgi:phosphoribulokinase
MFDVRVYLDPPEELRRHWKVQRDCSRRGYTTDQVLSELDRREPDSEAFIRPQRHHADVVVAFQPGVGDDQEHLDAKLTLRDTLSHPDLSGVIADGAEEGLVLTEKQGAQEICVPGRLSPERAWQLEEAIWEKMHFARHLRQQALGEFTIGTELHRSDSLALVQLVVLYHVLTARHLVSLNAGTTELDEVTG